MRLESIHEPERELPVIAEPDVLVVGGGFGGLLRDGFWLDAHAGPALQRLALGVAYRGQAYHGWQSQPDGRTVQDTAEHLKTAWPDIRRKLLDGSYRPAPVRRVAIPKPGGGQRELGIPTVVDRLIQQALLQVLQPLIDPSFSEHSHGFRPGRSAHGAVRQAQRYVHEGRQVVVDVDLEKFFDCVNHDILMDRLAKRIADKRVLKLIRLYLQAGIMAAGVCIGRDTCKQASSPMGITSGEKPAHRKAAP